MRALLIGLLLLMVPCGVLAQPPAASPAPALTPAQARAALDVLNDPKKRAEVTTTLEAIAKAQPTPAQPTPAAAAPAPGAAANPAAGAAPTGLQIPLAPDSLGAQVLVGAESFLNRVSTDAANATQAMQSLPLLWGWIVVMATTSWARDILLDVAWRAALALLCGLAAEVALRFLLRRPVAALEALAPAGPHTSADGTAAGAAPAHDSRAEDDEAEDDEAEDDEARHDEAQRDESEHYGPEQDGAEQDRAEQGGAAQDGAVRQGAARQGAVRQGAVRQGADRNKQEPPEDEPDEAATDAAGGPAYGPPPPDDPVARAEAGDIEPPVRHHRALPAEVLLRRVPLVLARLLLDLVPVLGFLVAGHLITASAIGGQASARLVMLAVVDSYALCIALLSVARMLLSPGASRLRLFRLPNTLATYLMRWTRRLIIIAVVGYVIGEVGLLLGLSDVAHEGLQKAVGFVLHACLATIVLQKRRAVRRRLRAPPGATGPTARMRNALASVWHWIALFFIVAIWLVWAVEIRDGFTRLLHFFVVTALLLIAARLVLILLDGSLDRVLNVPPETAARYPGLEARLRLYHPAISALLRAVIYLLCALALLQLYGFGTFTWFGESELGQRIVSALGTLAVTLLLAFAGWEAANAAIQRHLAKLAKEQQLARSARLRTLLPLLRSALLITILVFAGLTVLSEIGINIAPLLAGAGIIGVAVGFGSQKLVQDFITGIFLLLENAMQVGDTVTVGGLTGMVENLSVRTIRLRAGDGSVHIIPFSSVTTVTNVNRGLGNAPVSVTVEFEEDTDRVAAVLAEIVAGMRAEADFNGKMLSDLQLWGVDKVDGAGATIVGQMVCTDSGRWSVQREFNRRMKKRFQELGIRLYNPMRNVAVTLPPMGPPEGPAGAQPSPGTAGKEQAHEQARAAE